MIPYFIEKATPRDDISDNNIMTYYDCSEKDKINKKIIDYIIEVIYEFCSKDYGHNLKIISYEDFCNKYWKIAEFTIKDYNYIFKIYYFENEWIEWNIIDYQEDIYNSYMNKYIIN